MWVPSTWPLALLELIFLAVSLTAPSPVSAQFNNPAGVDIWCGKAYRPENASFNPGGSFEYPPAGDTPLLRLRATPRMSIYLETDAAAALVVDAEVSYEAGEPVPGDVLLAAPPMPLQVTVLLPPGAEGEEAVVLGSATVAVGSRGNEVPVSLARLAPRPAPYRLTVEARLLLVPGPGGNATAAARVYTTTTTTTTTTTALSYLAYPDAHGSVARLDRLHGGIYAQRGRNSSWTAIFPYTYYVQWSLYWDADVSTLDDFAAMGYSLIHIVPTGTLGASPFPWDQFQPYLDRAAELGLWLQYDVLWTPDDATSMVEQVTRLRTHPSILTWYQSDEADGKSNPPNSTGLAYDALKELDPYHPVSLALNCYDFYYADYAAGADIIVPDVYPISTNTSYSSVYGTVCNATYGCCGCDDCGAGPTVFSDIPRRLDEFRRRDDALGWAKTQWFAPQAFGGETFWARYPTAAELAVMTLLAVNHGAKGLTMWDFPTTDALARSTRALAALFTATDAPRLLLGAERHQDLAVAVAVVGGGGGGGGGALVDAAAWVDRAGGRALVSVANLDHGASPGPVAVALPEGTEALGVAEVLWRGGAAGWEVVGPGGTHVGAAAGLAGLETAVFVVHLA